MEALAQRLGGEGSFTAKSGRGMDWSDALLFHHTDFGAAETTPAQADEGAANSMSTPSTPTSARPQPAVSTPVPSLPPHRVRLSGDYATRALKGMCG